LDFGREIGIHQRFGGRLRLPKMRCKRADAPLDWTIPMHSHRLNHGMLYATVYAQAPCSGDERSRHFRASRSAHAPVPASNNAEMTCGAGLVMPFQLPRLSA
jgi:hypothetical protein